MIQDHQEYRTIKQKAAMRIKQKAAMSPVYSGHVPEFDIVHFQSLPLTKHFHTKFMSPRVTTPYFIDIDGFDELEICGSSVSHSY